MGKEKIDEVFRTWDINGDGKLSKEEIKLGYAEFFGKSLSDDEVDEMFARVDQDGNGEIEYSEFVVATMNEKHLLSATSCRRPSRCSTRTAEALSRPTRSSRSSPSGRPSTSRSSTPSSSRLMKMAT